MVAPGRFELPTSGLGNRCSIHLSYGATLLINNLATHYQRFVGFCRLMCYRDRMSQKKGERGRGHIYLQHGAWYLKFYQSENRDGGLKKVRKTVFLHDKDREHN